MVGPDYKRAALRVKGRVQGVFFRQSTKEEALRLGLTGWVRNLLNGEVEAVAEGPAPAVDRFVAWCRQGPPYALVTEVKVSESSATGEFVTFRIER